MISYAPYHYVSHSCFKIMEYEMKLCEKEERQKGDIALETTASSGRCQPDRRSNPILQQCVLNGQGRHPEGN